MIKINFPYESGYFSIYDIRMRISGLQNFIEEIEGKIAKLDKNASNYESQYCLLTGIPELVLQDIDILERAAEIEETKSAIIQRNERLQYQENQRNGIEGYEPPKKGQMELF
jgi:hypothetical protein